MLEPHVLYYRWFATDVAQDGWEAEVSSDGGSSWTLLESTNLDERFWQAFDFDLTGVLSSFDAVRFRFIARDSPPENLVEAALDDFTLYDAALSTTNGPIAPAAGPTLSLSPGAPTDPSSSLDCASAA